jgi:thiol:disulfide interchange protein DsbD
LSLVSILGFLFAVGCQAQEPERFKGFAKPQQQPVKTDLIAEHEWVQPNGQTRIGVLFQMEPGWHIYAKEPGDAGLPTTITWEAPDGASIGPVDYPTPERLLDPGEIRTFGYQEEVVLSSRLSVTTAAETVPLRAYVKWLACKEICIPGETELQAAIPIRSDTPPATSEAPLFP